MDPHAWNHCVDGATRTPVAAIIVPETCGREAAGTRTGPTDGAAGPVRAELMVPYW